MRDCNYLNNNETMMSVAMTCFCFAPPSELCRVCDDEVGTPLCWCGVT